MTRHPMSPETVAALCALMREGRDAKEAYEAAEKERSEKMLALARADVGEITGSVKALHATQEWEV